MCSEEGKAVCRGILLSQGVFRYPSFRSSHIESDVYRETQFEDLQADTGEANVDLPAVASPGAVGAQMTDPNVLNEGRPAQRLSLFKLLKIQEPYPWVPVIRSVKHPK